MVKGAREINPFGLRMPADVRAALEASAGERGVSLNAEIVYRLRRSLEAPPSTGSDHVEYRLKAIEHQLGLFGPTKARKGKRR